MVRESSEIRQNNHHWSFFTYRNRCHFSAPRFCRACPMRACGFSDPVEERTGLLGPWRRRATGVGRWDDYNSLETLIFVASRWKVSCRFILNYPWISSGGSFLNGSAWSQPPKKNMEFWVSGLDPCKGSPAIVLLIRVCGEYEPPKQRTSYCKH